MNDLISDIKNLELETIKNLRNSKAHNTLRAYQADFRDFSAFCIKNGLASMPTEPKILSIYLTHLSKSSKYSTIILTLLSLVVIGGLIGGGVYYVRLKMPIPIVESYFQAMLECDLKTARGYIHPDCTALTCQQIRESKQKYTENCLQEKKVTKSEIQSLKELINFSKIPRELNNPPFPILVGYLGYPMIQLMENIELNNKTYCKVDVGWPGTGGDTCWCPETCTVVVRRYRATSRRI